MCPYQDANLFRNSLSISTLFEQERPLQAYSDSQAVIVYTYQEEEVANILRVLYHVVLLPLMQADSLPPQFEDLGGPIEPSRISLLQRGGDMIVECTRTKNRLSGENTYLVLPTATTECPDQRLFLLPSSPHPQRQTKINDISSCSIVLI